MHDAPFYFEANANPRLVVGARCWPADDQRSGCSASIRLSRQLSRLRKALRSGQGAVQLGALPHQNLRSQVRSMCGRRSRVVSPDQHHFHRLAERALSARSRWPRTCQASSEPQPHRSDRSGWPGASSGQRQRRYCASATNRRDCPGQSWWVFIGEAIGHRVPCDDVRSRVDLCST
jgi:hypothetical protein